MDFDFTASGNVTIVGCGGYTFKILRTLRYALGSKVYDIKKARRGELEYVYLKDYMIRLNAYHEKRTLYLDTLNGMWNEEDLCDHATAVALAEDWWALLKSHAGEALLRAQCKKC